ncbi:hypothetical protein PQD09_gp74 [Providencia phage PSTCR4]|uniref:Uncharacterized protein n=1 Tax=Providencia phage PSTCR4 TaxID=2783546 RepID=A0A873WQ20_9CAUD|nr:hypothetical protein PQD09_gp74 [Providencia phage PSTCR4]QPB12095.1 hypothetical protein [Providencia phage PSTCR4]
MELNINNVVTFNQKCRLLRNIGYRIYNLGAYYVVDEMLPNGDYKNIATLHIRRRPALVHCVHVLFMLYKDRVNLNA